MNNISLIALMIVVAAEVILSVTWNKVYFSMGIVIFSKGSVMPMTGGQSRNAAAFQSHFNDAFRGTRMLFHDIEPGMVAFREKMIEFRFMAFHYSPIMHGIIITETATGRVTVKGILNWTAIVILGIFIWTSFPILAMSWIELVFPVFILGLLLLIYWIQFRRYIKILEFACI